MAANLNDFKRETTCIYRNEQYTVRDNGAVLRHTPENKRPRPTDNNWTFGKPNVEKGQMEIASVPVHRIVATAFHGEPPTPQHVVDHIDTNKRNNRPENLRWVTRLENILLNPITAKRITLICGSVEAFLAEPSKFKELFQEPNYPWMRTVSPEEAKISKERLLAWAASDKSFSGKTLDEWIFRNDYDYYPVQESPEFLPSKNPNAVQKNLKELSLFPLCPVENIENPLKAYLTNLKIGAIFLNNKYGQSIISDFAFSKDEASLLVLVEYRNNEIKPWFLIEITYENELFVHEVRGSYFEKIGAEKQFTIAQGKEWTGADSIDDYC